MKFTPHEYQRRAIAWVEDHPRCALFLDMGLGKTVSTLTAVSHLIMGCEVERVLVIAPKKVAESTWSDEAGKWDHLRWLRVSEVKGTSAQRAKALEREAEVHVIGRDSVTWLEQHLKERKKGMPFDMVVIDELTSFKNSRAIRFKALRRMLAGVARVVGLTGTPSPNGLLDLWGQMCIIDGGERLGRFVTHYRERWFHCVTHNNIVIKATPRKGAQEEIMAAISDITLAMRAEDWLSLPPVTITDVRVRLGEKTMKDYVRFERECVAEMARDDGGRTVITADSAGALVNKLMQYANGAIYDSEGNVTRIHVEKTAALLEIMEAEASPLLCFYQFRHDVTGIMKVLPKGVSAREYKGAEDLREWNEGKIDLLLAHPASTAYGLNMQQGGSRIVWYSTGWNLEHYQQANARLHRQGQERPVRVFNLVATGTVDERMAAAIRGKAETQRGILQRLAMGIVKGDKEK